MENVIILMVELILVLHLRKGHVEVIGLNHLNQKSVVNYQISDLSRMLQDMKKICYIFKFPEESILYMVIDY